MLHGTRVMSRGEQLGRYRVLELIGQGGMGTVHLGEHELLRHRVAIKILHDRHTRDPGMERRFYNEARAIAALEHPGIVKLFDIGRASDGRAYLVMELLRGETLRQRIGARGVARAQLVPFAIQIASALGAAHEAGIVHRDVKPENVFIVSDPDIATGERVKILDFGVAKRTQLSLTPSPEITRTGVLLGTPAYMAPEQCRGDDEIDARADIYAFGVLLFEMVSGALPFSSPNTEEVLSKQIYCAPPPLPPGPGIPRGLIDLVARCLAKAPIDRFATMAEVGEALQALVASGPAAAASIAPFEDDDASDDFPDLETMPIARRLEDATTGVVITAAPPLEPASRRRALLALGAVAAIAVAIAIARGLAGAPSQVTEAVASTVEDADDDTAEERAAAAPDEPRARRDERASRESARANRPVPRPPAVAPTRPAPPARTADPLARKAAEPTRQTAPPARPPAKPARRAPEGTESSKSTEAAKTGDPFAEIEPPIVF